MSLADEIRAAFVLEVPELARDAVDLLEIIFASSDPETAISSAKLALAADAADLATDMVTDAALRASVGKSNEPPA